MKKIVLGVLLAGMVWMLSRPGNAAALNIPHFLNYQSLLYDDGGNLLPDGQTSITFRITNVNGELLFEEHQVVNVINGYASAIVGNGLDVNGAPVGGIPESVLAPDSSKFLEVTAANYPPEAGLEIVSVPYSVYSEKALSVADGSIQRAHLADELIEQLAREMGEGDVVATTTDLSNLQTTYSSSAGAANIGVNTGLTYSSGTNVQIVVQDFDRAILDRQNADMTHANNDINVAHPNGDFPVNRLNTDICTQAELEGHTHTGGADGANLNGVAFWTDAGSVSDDESVTVPSDFDVNNCKMVVGVYNLGLFVRDANNVTYCARYCREGNSFRIRCRAQSVTGGSLDCAGFLGETNEVEGTVCDGGGFTSGSECRVSYMVFCPR